MCLLPVTWHDGWPILGEPGPDGLGRMVWSARKPLQGQQPCRPQTSDEFNDSKLSVQWEWNYHPAQ